MTSRNLARPIFPLPPEEYSRQYMDTLVQAFSVYLEQYQNPGEGRTTKSVMTNIPTTPVGSEDGTVWVDSSILRVGSGGTPGTFVIPNLEVTTLLDVSGTLDITGVFDIAGTTVTASAVELNYNDITTLGTVQENKTVTAGAAKAIDFDNAPIANVDINSGAIDGTPIGAASASTGSFTDLGSSGTATLATANITTANITTVDIDGGAIDGTTVGFTTPSTGAFTTLNVTTTFQLAGSTVTATATELNYNDITTLGTVEANKTVTAGTAGAINFSSGSLTNVNIDSGTVDGATIGATTPSTGVFTTLDVSGSNNGVTGVNANNILRLVDTDISTAVDQPNGMIQFINSDLTTLLAAYILSLSPSSSGGGDLRFGTSTSGGVVAEVAKLNQNGFVLPRLTTAQRDAIASPDEAALIYNTTTSKLNFYNGTAWEQVTSA